MITDSVFSVINLAATVIIRYDHVGNLKAKTLRGAPGTVYHIKKTNVSINIDVNKIEIKTEIEIKM